MKFQISTRWQVGNAEVIDERLFPLLRGIASGGSLRFAATELGVSYRHAWGLIQTGEQILGQNLVAKTRGRGAVLTPAGEKLLQIQGDAQAQLSDALSQASAQASRQWQSMSAGAGQTLRIVASHAYALEKLCHALREQGTELALQVVGSSEALARFRAGQCDIAGFHLPRGPLGQVIAAQLLEGLDELGPEFVLLETREQGFITRPQYSCETLDELVTRRYRFVNRQSGAGSRLIFDAMLDAGGIHASDIVGYEHEELTHDAVAALVLGKAADVGFGVREAAEAFGLKFSKMLDEDYYLAWSADGMDPMLRREILGLIGAIARKRQTRLSGHGSTRAPRCLSLSALARRHRASASAV